MAGLDYVWLVNATVLCQRWVGLGWVGLGWVGFNKS